MNILETIDSDLKSAMIQKAELELSVLRMLKASIHNREIEAKGKLLTDEEIIKILGTELKKRKDAATAFKQGGRDELAAKEVKESAIIKKYLPARSPRACEADGPQQLDEEGVEKIVQEVIKEQDEAQRNFGLIMKNAMAKAKGRADGNMVAKIVKSVLQGN